MRIIRILRIYIINILFIGNLIASPSDVLLPSSISTQQNNNQQDNATQSAIVNQKMYQNISDENRNTMIKLYGNNRNQLQINPIPGGGSSSNPAYKEEGNKPLPTPDTSTGDSTQGTTPDNTPNSSGSSSEQGTNNDGKNDQSTTDDLDAADANEKNDLNNNSSTSKPPEQSTEGSKDDGQTEDSEKNENITPEIPGPPPEGSEGTEVSKDPEPEGSEGGKDGSNPPTEEVVENKGDKWSASDIFAGIAAGTGAAAAAGAAAAGGIYIYDKLFGGDKTPEKPEVNTGISIDEDLFNKSPSKIDSRSIDFAGAQEEAYIKKPNSSEEMKKGSSFADKISNMGSGFKGLFSKEEGEQKVPEKGGTITNEDLLKYLSNNQTEEEKKSGILSSLGDFVSNNAGAITVGIGGLTATSLGSAAIAYILKKQESGESVGILDSLKSLVGGAGSKNDKIDSIIGSITSNGTETGGQGENTGQSSEGGFGFDSSGSGESETSSSTSDKAGNSFGMNDGVFGGIFDKISNSTQNVVDSIKNAFGGGEKEQEVQAEPGYNIDQLKELVKKNGIETSDEVVHKVLSKRPVTQDELLNSLKQLGIKEAEDLIPKNTVTREELSNITGKFDLHINEEELGALTVGGAISVEKARELLVSKRPELKRVINNILPDKDTTITEEKAKEIIKQAKGEKYDEGMADIVLQGRHNISKEECTDFLNAIIDEHEAQNKLNNGSNNQNSNNNSSQADGKNPNDNAEKVENKSNGNTGFFLDYATGIFNFYDGSTSNDNKPSEEDKGFDGKFPDNGAQGEQNDNNQKSPVRTDFVDLDGLPLSGDTNKSPDTGTNSGGEGTSGNGAFGMPDTGTNSGSEGTSGNGAFVIPDTGGNNNQQNNGNQGTFGDGSFGMPDTGSSAGNANNGSSGGNSNNFFNMSGGSDFGGNSNFSANYGGFGFPTDSNNNSSSIWDIFGLGNKNSSSNSFGFSDNSFGFSNTNQSSGISSNTMLGVGAGALGIGAIAALLYGNKDAISDSLDKGALSGVKDFAGDIGNEFLSFAKENKAITLAGALGVGALGLKFLSNNNSSNTYNQSFGLSSMYGSSYGTSSIFGGYRAPLTNIQTYGLTAGLAGLLTAGWGVYDTYQNNKELDEKQAEADKKVLETVDPVRKLMNNSKTAVDETMAKIGGLYANKLNGVKVPYEQAKEEMAFATENRQKAEQTLADAEERLKSVPDKYKAQARAEVEEAKKALNIAKKEESNAKKHLEEKKKAYNSIIDIADKEEAVNTAEKNVNEIKSKLDIVTAKEEELKKAEEKLKKAAPQDKEAAAENYYRIKNEYSALGATSASLNLDLVKAQNNLDNVKKEHGKTQQVTDILGRIAEAQAGLPDTQDELDIAHQELAKAIEENGIDIKLSGTEKKELDSHKRELDSAKEQHKSSEETFNMAVEDTATIKELRKALEADPNNATLKAKLAEAQAELKEKAQNLNDLENQIAKNPKDKDLQQEYDKAKEEFENATKAEPQGERESYLNSKTIGGTVAAAVGGTVFGKMGFANTYSGNSLYGGSSLFGGSSLLSGTSLLGNLFGGSSLIGGNSLSNGLFGGTALSGEGLYRDANGLLYSYNSPTGILNSTTGAGAVLAGLGGLTLLTDQIYGDVKEEKAQKKQEENTKKIVNSLEYNRGNKTAADQEVEKAKAELGNFYSDKLESVRGPYYAAKSELENAKDKQKQAAEDLEKAKTRLENAPNEFKAEARAALAEAEKDLEAANKKVDQAEENLNKASKAFDEMTGIPKKEKALESAKSALEEAQEKLDIINEAEERMREAEKNMDNADPSEIKEATAEYYKAKKAYDNLKGDKDKLEDDVKKYSDALDTAQKDYDSAKKLGDALEAINAAEEKLPESAAELEQAKKDLYESIKDGSTDIKLSEEDKKGLKELENKLTETQAKREEHSKALESSVDQFGKVAEAKKAYEADPTNPVLKAKYESLKEEAMGKVDKLNSAEQKLKDNPEDKSAQLEYDIAKKAVSDIAVAPEEKVNENKGLNVKLFGKEVNISTSGIGKAASLAGAAVTALGVTKGMGTFNSIGIGNILTGNRTGNSGIANSMGLGSTGMGGMGTMGGIGGMGTMGTSSTGGSGSKMLGALGAVGGLGVAAIGVKGLLSGEKDIGTIGATVLGGGAAAWGATKLLGIGGGSNKVAEAERRVKEANGGLLGGGLFSGAQSSGPMMGNSGSKMLANKDEEVLIKAGKVGMTKPVTLREENGVVKKVETYNIGGKEVEYVRGNASVGLTGKIVDSQNDFKKYGTFARDEFETDNKGNITVHHVYKSGDGEVRHSEPISRKDLTNKYQYEPISDPVLRKDKNGNIMVVRKFEKNGQTFEDIKPASKDKIINLHYEDEDQNANKNVDPNIELDKKIADLKKSPKKNADLISALEKQKAENLEKQRTQMKKETEELREVNGQVMVVNKTIGKDGKIIEESRPANEGGMISENDFAKHGFSEKGDRQLKKSPDGKVMVVKTFQGEGGKTITHMSPAKEDGMFSKGDIKKYGTKTDEFKADNNGNVTLHHVYKDVDGNEVLREEEKVSHDELVKKHNFTPVGEPSLRKDSNGNILVVKKVKNPMDGNTIEHIEPATQDHIMKLHYEGTSLEDYDQELEKKINDVKKMQAGNIDTNKTLKALEKEQQNRKDNKEALKKTNDEITEHKETLKKLQDEAGALKERQELNDKKSQLLKQRQELKKKNAEKEKSSEIMNQKIADLENDNKSLQDFIDNNIIKPGDPSYNSVQAKIEANKTQINNLQNQQKAAAEKHKIEAEKAKKEIKSTTEELKKAGVSLEDLTDATLEESITNEQNQINAQALNSNKQTKEVQSNLEKAEKKKEQLQKQLGVQDDDSNTADATSSGMTQRAAMQGVKSGASSPQSEGSKGILVQPSGTNLMDLADGNGEMKKHGSNSENPSRYNDHYNYMVKDHIDVLKDATGHDVTVFQQSGSEEQRTTLEKYKTAIDGAEKNITIKEKELTTQQKNLENISKKVEELQKAVNKNPDDESKKQELEQAQKALEQQKQIVAEYQYSIHDAKIDVAKAKDNYDQLVVAHDPEEFANSKKILEEKEKELKKQKEAVSDKQQELARLPHPSSLEDEIEFNKKEIADIDEKLKGSLTKDQKTTLENRKKELQENNENNKKQIEKAKSLEEQAAELEKGLKEVESQKKELNNRETKAQQKVAEANKKKEQENIQKPSSKESSTTGNNNSSSNTGSGTNNKDNNGAASSKEGGTKGSSQGGDTQSSAQDGGTKGSSQNNSVKESGPALEDLADGSASNNSSTNGSGNSSKPQPSTSLEDMATGDPVPGQNFDGNTPAIGSGQGNLSGDVKDNPVLSGGSGGRDWRSILDTIVGVGGTVAGIGMGVAALGAAGYGVYKLVDAIKGNDSDDKSPELDEIAKKGEEFNNRAQEIESKYGEGLEGALNAIKSSFNVDLDGMLKKLKEGLPLSDEEKNALKDPKLTEHIQKNIEGRYNIDLMGLLSEYSNFHDNASKIIKESADKKNAAMNSEKLSTDSKAKNALAYVAGMASELGYDNFREVMEAIQSGEGDKHKEDITKMLADPKFKEILNSVKDNPEYSNMDFSAIMSPHVDLDAQKATETKAKDTEEESNKVKEEMSKLQDEIMDLNINDEDVKRAGDILSSSENLKNIDTKALFDEINKNGINSAIDKGLITEDQLKEISGNKEIMDALANECPNIKTALEKSQEILDKSKTALMIQPSKVAEEIEKSLAEGKVENGEELLKKEQQGIELTPDEKESLSLYKAQQEVSDLLNKMKNGEVITTEDHQKAYSSIIKALPEEDATKLNSEIDRYLTEIRAETNKVAKAKEEEQAKLQEKISDIKGELKNATIPLSDKEKAKDIIEKYPELKDVDVDKLISDIKSGDLKEDDIKKIAGNDALMKELAAESPTFADFLMKADDVINKTIEATKVEPNASAKEVISKIEEKLNDKNNPLTEEQKEAYTPEVKKILDDMKAGKVVDPELISKNEENIKNIAEALGMDPEKLLNECKEYSNNSQKALENMKSETNSVAVEKANETKEKELNNTNSSEEAKSNTSKNNKVTENTPAKDTEALFDPRVSSGSPAADAISDKKFGTGNLSDSDKTSVSGIVNGVKSLDELNKDLDKLSEGLKDSSGNEIKLSDVIKKVADGTISPAEVNKIITDPELREKLENTFKQHGMEDMLDEIKTFADKADNAKEAGQLFKEKVSSSSALRQDLANIKDTYGVDTKDILNKLADGSVTPEEIKKITDNPELAREIKKVCQKYGLDDVMKAVEDFNKPYTKESTSKAAKEFNDVINKNESLSNAVNELKNKTGVDLKDVMQKIEQGTLTPAEAKAVMSNPDIASAVKELCENNGLGEAYRSLNSISNAFDKGHAADSAKNFLNAAKESDDLHNSIKGVGDKHGVDVVDIIEKIANGQATDEDIKKITDNPELKEELKKALTEKGFGDVYASIENVNKPKVDALDSVKASNALDKISEDVGVDIKGVLDAIHNGEGPNYRDLSTIINNPEIMQKLKDAGEAIGMDVSSILSKYKDDVDEHAKKIDEVKTKELYGDKDIEKVLGNPDLAKNLDDVYEIDGAKVTDLLEKMANGEDVSKEDIDKFLNDPDIRAQLETIDNVRGTNIVDSLEKYPGNRYQKEIEQKNRASNSIGNLLLNGGPKGGMHDELLEIDMKLNKMDPKISEILKDIVAGNSEKHLGKIDQILNSNEPEFQNVRDVLKQVSDKYGLDVAMVLDNTLNNTTELKKLANDKLNEQKANKIKELYGDEKAQDVLKQINGSGSANIAWSQLEGMDEVKDLLTRMSNGETISEEEINKIQNDENLSEKISKFEKASNIKLNELFDSYNPTRDEKIKNYQKEVAGEEIKKLMYTSDGDVHPGLAVAAIQLSDYGISDLNKIIDDINTGSLDVNTYNMLRENVLGNPEVEQKLDRINDLYGVDLRTIFEYGETSYLEQHESERIEREKILNDPRAVAIVNKMDTEGKFKGIINGLKGVYGVDIPGLLSRMAVGEEISEEEIKAVLGNKQLLDELKQTDKTHGTEIVSTFNNYIKDREMRDLGFRDKENSDKVKDILTNNADAVSHADIMLKRYGISITDVLNGITGDNPHLYEGQISKLLDPDNEEMSKIVENIESEYGIDLKSVLEFGKEKIEKTDPVSYVGGHLQDMRAKVALEQMSGTNTEVILSAYTQKYDVNVYELFQRMAEGEEISEEDIKKVTENEALYKELSALSLSSGIDFHGIIETYTEDRQVRDYLKKKSNADAEMSKLIPDSGNVHGAVAYANVLMDDYMGKYGIGFEDLLKEIKSGDFTKHEGTLNELLNNPTVMTILKETDAAHGSNMVSVLESAKETIDFNRKEDKIAQEKKHKALSLDFNELTVLDRKQVNEKLDAVKLGSDGHTLKTLIDNISKGMMPGASEGDKERYNHAINTIKENGLLNEETTVGKQFLTILRNIDEGYGTYIENSLKEHVNGSLEIMKDKVADVVYQSSTKLSYLDDIDSENHARVKNKLEELTVGSWNMREVMDALSRGEGDALYDKALAELKNSGALENEEFMEGIRKIDADHGGSIENLLMIAKESLPQDEIKQKIEGGKVETAAYDPLQNISPNVRSFIEDMQSQINKLETNMYQTQYNVTNSEKDSKEKAKEEISPAVKKVIEDLQSQVNKLEMSLHETRYNIENIKEVTKETEPINIEHIIADPKFMEEFGKQLREQFMHERGAVSEISHEHAAKHNSKRAQETHSKSGSTTTSVAAAA